MLSKEEQLVRLSSLVNDILSTDKTDDGFVDVVTKGILDAYELGVDVAIDTVRGEI